jgi:predicted metal-dependent hydrolase
MEERKIISVRDIDVLVIKKNIKNYHLNVLPTDGKVRVSVPHDVSDEVIRAFVIRKYDWIKKHINSFKEQERQPVRNYVSGESHYLRGNRYILRIETTNKPKIEIRGKKYIYFYVPEHYTKEDKERYFEKWLRKELQKDLDILVPKWEKIMNLKVNESRIKKMKTKWGSCNPNAKRIWINLELIKKPPKYLEYVIVHEFVHFMERKHNDRFKAIMDKYMPGWETYRRDLNEFIL